MSLTIIVPPTPLPDVTLCRPRQDLPYDEFYEAHSHMRPLGPFVPLRPVTSRKYFPFIDMPPK